MRILGFLFILSVSVTFSQSNEIDLKEVEKIVREDWKGELQYRNYKDDKLFTIKVDLEVIKISDRKFKLSYNYPDEPKANGGSSITISKDGKRLGKQQVLNTQLTNDGYQITTGYWGKDNNEKSYIKMIYDISETRFEMTKLVAKKEGEEGEFRNKYGFKAE